jgi:site-specific recombinase
VTSLLPSDERLFDAKGFVVRFAHLAPGGRVRFVRRLFGLLTSVEQANTPTLLLEWIEDWAAWMRTKRSDVSRNQFLRLFLEVLEQCPQERHSVNAALRRALESTSGIRLFSDTGLPTENGFFAEAFNRFSLRVLPEAPDASDLAQILWRCFPSENDAAWLESVSDKTLSRLVQLLPALDVESVSSLLRPDLRQAAHLLAVRVSSLGLADDVRARSPLVPIAESPFVELTHAVEAALNTQDFVPLSKPAPVRAREAISNCRKSVHAVLASLEVSGVSVDLVYRLERITKSLDRLYALLTLIHSADEKTLSLVRKRFFVALLRGATNDRSLFDIVSRSSRQLARKVIERAGNTGEHYITSNRKDYHDMISSAGGGGALTAITAMFKFFVVWANFPSFFEGLFASLNYSLSFTGIQLAGFTLATKQPSMTAAALAANIRERNAEETPDLEPLLDQIARLTRSQLAAIIGNLGIVVPVCIGFDFLIRLATGHGLLNADTAAYVVHSFDPFHTLTIFWAALTGVFLWLSSLGAGALENWAVYRHLPEALSSLRWVRWLLGPERSRKIPAALRRNIAGFGGNMTLGVLLGMATPVGKFFGIPLGAAHVTLSTAQLTYAAMTQGPEAVVQTPFLFALLGIVFIAVLNFGVSFSLALLVALRARDLGAKTQLRLGQALLRRLWRSPGSFFFPPPDGQQVPAPIISSSSDSSPDH